MVMRIKWGTGDMAKPRYNSNSRDDNVDKRVATAKANPRRKTHKTRTTSNTNPFKSSGW